MGQIKKQYYKVVYPLVNYDKRTFSIFLTEKHKEKGIIKIKGKKYKIKHINETDKIIEVE